MFNGFCKPKNKKRCCQWGSISKTYGELIFYSFILHSIVLAFSRTFFEQHLMLQDSKDLS